MAIGPLAPPIIPSEAASLEVNPIRMATSNTVNIPNCVAALNMESCRLRNIEPKSAPFKNLVLMKIVYS